MSQKSIVQDELSYICLTNVSKVPIPGVGQCGRDDGEDGEKEEYVLVERDEDNVENDPT